MDSLIATHDKLERQGGLGQTINDVQAMIDLLSNARASVAADGESTPMTMAKLKTPINQSFTKLNQDVKELHAAMNNYSKALDKKFKNLILPTASNDPFSSHPHLTNRAIGMHLLREGQFGVASTFIEEANARPPRPQSITDPSGQSPEGVQNVAENKSWAHDFSTAVSEADDMRDVDYNFQDESPDLQRKFSDMYRILAALGNERNLGPAISWAKAHSDALEARGSNLQFELCRLQFIELYRADSEGDGSGRLKALDYARQTFPHFSQRYVREISSLLGSLAFGPAIAQSPYTHAFFNNEAWDEVANSFVREFCGLLGLSEKSPLYTAVTAGGIALPVLEKLERVMGEVGGQWTSANELPVEIPLPPPYLFHSIFVCPVSKEQATDKNPAMMMPCGHVIASESLEKVSRGGK